MIDFSIADKIYLGDTEVSKLYKGTELLYEKQTSGGVHVENGKLVFPEGLIVNIEDYTAPEPTTLAYPLPKEIQITGADHYMEQFDDGTRFSLYADMEGINYEYADGIKQYYLNSGTTSYSIENITSRIYFTKLHSNNYYFNSSSNTFPIGSCFGICTFKVEQTYEDTELWLRMEDFNTGYYNYIGDKINATAAYIHDFGTENPSSSYFFDFYYKSPKNGKYAENDIELELSLGSSSDKYTLIRKKGLTFEAGHSYTVYCISAKQSYFSGNQSGTCREMLLSLTREISYNNYDKDMYISGNGYAFGPDEKQVQISVTDREPHPEWGELAFGITRYNPTQGWYSLTPPN